MTAEEAAQYIHGNSWRGSVFGLSRISELLARMGFPQNRLRFVHIAGTNGKGSTAAMTDSILRAAGYRTGLFTSPYIRRFNERMQVNGEVIPDALLGEITEFVKEHAEAMEDKPTEFELVTAVGMEYFARERCDIVVLEVGLGGALDSTNVIVSPEAAVITNIGLEHTEVLGDTLEEIASAKAGIIKPGCAAVTYRGAPEVEGVFEIVCAEKGAELIKADFDGIRAVSHSLSGQVFDWRYMRGLGLPLLGENQLRNAAVAIETALALQKRGWHVSEEHIRRGLASVKWPARFEVLACCPLFILDGGHNPQCIDSLVRNIRDYLPDIRRIFLVGVLGDKDCRLMFEKCAILADSFVTVTPDSPRALPSSELAKLLQRYGRPVTDCGDIREGIREALRQAGDEKAVCSFGSLYMCGAIEEFFAVRDK